MTSSPWLRDLFRPLLVALMIALVLHSILAVVELFLPRLRVGLLVLIALVAAAEAHYSHRLLQLAPRGGEERLRFRLTELAALLVIGQAILLIGPLLEVLPTWLRPGAPRLPLLWPPESLISVAVVILAWNAARTSSIDLDRADAPLRFPNFGDLPPKMSLLTRIRLAPLLAYEPQIPGRPPPLQSLTGAFFTGGLVLFTAAGIRRIGLSAILDLSRPPVTGVVLGVLAYFAIGFTILAQLRYATLKKRWIAEEVTVSPLLGRRWVRYSLGFLTLALILALLLPTGAGDGLLASLGIILAWTVALGAFAGLVLFFLITYPFALVLAYISRLLGLDTPISAGQPPTFEPPPFFESPQEPAGWIALLRVAVLWLLIIVALVYILRAYLRDHPALASARGKGTRATLALLWRLFLDWLRRVRRRLPSLVSRGRDTTPRHGARSLLEEETEPNEERARLRALYQRALRLLERHGRGRRPAQTPTEFERDVGRGLDDARSALERLTRLFESARYSRALPAPDDLPSARRALDHLDDWLTREEQGEEES